MNQRNTRRGFSLIELLIVIAIILIIAGIASGPLARSRRAANEMAAIRTVVTLHTAQTQYFSQFNRYATNLTELGPPSSGLASAAAEDLIPADLAAGKKGGYLYSLQPGPNGYQINANPETFGTTADRTFYSDQSQVIRQNRTPEPASVRSLPI